MNSKRSDSMAVVEFSLTPILMKAGFRPVESFEGEHYGWVRGNIDIILQDDGKLIVRDWTRRAASSKLVMEEPERTEFLKSLGVEGL